MFHLHLVSLEGKTSSFFFFKFMFCTLVQESCCEAACTLKIFLSFSEKCSSDKNYFASNFDTVPRVHSWNLLRYGDVNFPCYVCLCVMIDVFILMIITTKTTALPSKELDASGVWFGWKIVNPTDVGYIYTILPFILMFPLLHFPYLLNK